MSARVQVLGARLSTICSGPLCKSKDDLCITATRHCYACLRASTKLLTFLETAATHNLPELIKTLSDVLYHGGNFSVVRQQAGVQLKNFLYTNDEALRAQYEERWVAMPEDMRIYTKNNVLNTLGTECFRPSAAAQCIQVGEVEN